MLLTACMYGQADVVNYFVSTGAFKVNSVSGDNATALMQAAIKNHARIVRTLLAAALMQM